MAVAANGGVPLGLNWGRFWSGELPFPVARERARLGYSLYSIAIRFALLGMLAYWLCQRRRGDRRESNGNG